MIILEYSGIFLIILNLKFVNTSLLAECIEAVDSAMIYERESGPNEIMIFLLFYVIPVKSILGKLPVVPVGETGTIPFTMRVAERARDLSGARCDREMGNGDGNRCWFVNNWAMSWSREIPRK